MFVFAGQLPDRGPEIDCRERASVAGWRAAYVPAYPWAPTYEGRMADTEPRAQPRIAH
jgi:hypothetical protein